MENLLLNIDEREFEAKFSDEDFSLININGKNFNVELLKKYGQNIFSFAVNQRLMQVNIETDSDNNLLIAYDGLTYQIEVTNETKKMLSKFIQMSSSSNHSGAGKMKAPMPGMVVKILTHEGAEVNIGDKLIIIEAMKMENSLSSPVAGIVKSIKVKEGTAVEKDAVMIEIEPILI